jgi:hypothetical protein
MIDMQTNYIVSGIERSGTSMMMQILHIAELPLAFDSTRPADENNPKGYYELEGGKIINALMQNSFPFQQYLGKFVKITAFGLRYLPVGNYKIIYMERNIEEVLDSMEKMAKINDDNRQQTKQSFENLNQSIKQLIQKRQDIDVLFMNYNELLHNPEENLKKLCKFLNLDSLVFKQMQTVIDTRLYRQRRR